MPLSPKRILKQFKYGMYFNGVDNYVYVPHSDSLTVSYELTAIAWVNLFDPNIDQKLIGKSPIGSGWVIGVAGNRLYPEVWDSAGVKYSFRSGDIEANIWTFLATTWKTGERYKGYINAVVVYDAVASANPIGYTTNPLKIGSEPWGNVFFTKVLISNALVYSRALSDSEIQYNYQNPYNPITNGLVLWLQADPKYVKSNTWIDLSGYGNNGTIYGAQLMQLEKTPARILNAKRVLGAVR